MTRAARRPSRSLGQDAGAVKRPRGHGLRLATIPDTPGHTMLREVRLVGDHNGHHVGEFAILRQVVGPWPPGREG